MLDSLWRRFVAQMTTDRRKGVSCVDFVCLDPIVATKSRLLVLEADGPTAFVGNGIIDAPAPLTADLGGAIGAGTNVAIGSADLVLVDDDPADMVPALRLSSATHRKVIQDLAWAPTYNTIAIPWAPGGPFRPESC